MSERPYHVVRIGFEATEVHALKGQCWWSDFVSPECLSAQYTRQPAENQVVRSESAEIYV